MSVKEYQQELISTLTEVHTILTSMTKENHNTIDLQVRTVCTSDRVLSDSGFTQIKTKNFSST